MLVDSHCHLDFPDFEGDRDGVVERARAAGIGTMLTICTRLSAFRPVLAVAETYPDIWCSVGVHPHEAAREPGTEVMRLVEATAHPKVVALGETGLDYFYAKSPRERQQDCFRAHLEAARQTGLPVIVHARDADDDTAAILREACRGSRGEGAVTGVLHCFTATQALADAALELGFYISISGIVTFKKAEALRETVRSVPLDRLLVETDAPYLAPVPHRGVRNEPAFVAHTAAAVAALKQVDSVTLARATTENFFRLFAKAGRPTSPMSTRCG